MLQNLNNFVPSLDERKWLTHLICPKDTTSTEVTLEPKLRQSRKKLVTFRVTNEVDDGGDDDDDNDMSPNLATQLKFLYRMDSIEIRVNHVNYASIKGNICGHTVI